jgi:hypothetical protein
MYRLVIFHQFSDSHRFISFHMVSMPLATAKSRSSAMMRAVPGSAHSALQFADHETSTGEQYSAIGEIGR